MRWLLDNIQIVIAVAGIIAYYLNEYRRRKARQEQDEEGNLQEGEAEMERSETSALDLEEEERTRRIREEMLRKRAERAAGTNPSQGEASSLAPAPVSPAKKFEAPPPVYAGPMGEFARRLAKQMAPEPEERPGYLVDEEALQRQRKLEEQMRVLEAQRKEAVRKAEEARKATISKKSAAQDSALGGETWLSQLRSPEDVRRAIVMNEVLGKPVGLR